MRSEMTYNEVKTIFRTNFLGSCCIDFENGDGTNECECPNSDCDHCRVAEAERMILEALEKQSNIVHCRDCENWKFPFDGFNDNVGQCELTKWLCDEQGYCMYGREVE